jgi:hypothetical protein
MAGRPIRRAREVAKQNPLVGYINKSELTPRETFEPLALFSHPRAKDILASKYAKIPTNILVYYGPLKLRTWHTKGVSMKTLRELAERQKVTLLVVGEMGRRSDEPWYKNRIDLTRLTAFNLLHRWADQFFNDLEKRSYDFQREFDAGVDPSDCGWTDEEILAYDVYRKITNSRFQGSLGRSVDTKAGRLGRIHDGSQALADLFAKYMLTGKVALNIQYEGIPEVDNFLNSTAKKMELLLPAMEQEFNQPGAYYVGFNDDEIDE